MSSLEDRVRQLEDERAILQRIFDYYHAFDYGLADAFADCWTEQGALRLNADVANARLPTGIGNLEWLGRDTIMADYFWNHREQFPPEMYWKHLNINPRVTVDGDRATVESSWARLDENARGPYLCAFGETRDQLLREDDGKWRFLERRIGYDSRVQMGPKDRVPRSKIAAPA
jgi:SnoaL-like domain